MADFRIGNVSGTGIGELDRILNGGVPKNSIILLAGNSGTGKTTLAMQWLYGGTSKYNESGIYLALTEPITKTLKNASNFTFYKPSTNGAAVHFTDFRSVLRLLHINRAHISEKEIEKILATIKDLVSKTKAKRLVIDSITALCYILQDKDLIRTFIFRLGNILSQLNCTTILTSEVFGEKYSVFGVEQFICDGIIKLGTEKHGDKVVRNLQIAKMRGLSYNSDVHRFGIDKNGIKIFAKVGIELDYPASSKFIPSGVSGLDAMLGEGVLEGSTTLLIGSPGTGKSLLCMQFLYEGVKRGEPGLFVSFEESKEQLLRDAKAIGCDFTKYLSAGTFSVISLYPENLLPEENVFAIIDLIEKLKAKRCVIDSISAFRTASTDSDFRFFSRKVNGYLKSKVITSVFTLGANALVEASKITESQMSTLTDNIVMLKHIEVSGEMKSMVAVLKTRGSGHDKLLRSYIINNTGMVIGEAYTNLEGVMTGITRKISAGIGERLETEFRKYIGPMAAGAFDELKQQGLSAESVFAYINSLVKEGIMGEEEALEFQEKVASILGKPNLIKTEIKKSKSQQKESMMTKIFG